MNHASVRLYLESIPTKSWRTASDIQRTTGVNPKDMRKLANSFPQTFIGSNYGYKLARNATVAELDDVIRVLMSRAEKILHRARSLQRYTLERGKYNRRTVATTLRAVA